MDLVQSIKAFGFRTLKFNGRLLTCALMSNLLLLNVRSKAKRTLVKRLREDGTRL